MSVSATSLARVTAWFSGLFAVALGAGAFHFGSKLALAQAADSSLDFGAALLLSWAIHVAQTPGDERHPMGHARAEPLAALAVAAFAGVLSVEVAASAIRALLGESEVRLSFGLLGLFLGKLIFKAIVYKLSRSRRGSAFSALALDARNDLLVSSIAVVGFFGARAGIESLDALLALPAALWIGWSGVGLARENIDLLIGAAPPAERSREFLEIAAGTGGILNAHDLVAHSVGNSLSLHVHITVDENLTVRQAHDLGEAVRLRLMAEPDVSHCSVHIDPSD